MILKNKRKSNLLTQQCQSVTETTYIYILVCSHSGAYFIVGSQSSYTEILINTMKTSVAIIILIVCLSGMTINQADGVIIDCNWGGCPSHKACNFCCRHLHGLKRCSSGKCVNAGFTHCRLLLPFEIRQQYDTKSEKVGLVSSIIWNVLSLSERIRFSS